MRTVLRKIGNGLKSFGHFVAALSHPSTKSSAPDPRKAAARKMRESMHASRVATSAMSAPEPFYAKELSKGYEQQR